jgi:RNA polymerase sigma-32 factor
VIDMNRRLGGDASLNDTIREGGNSGEWQYWLVDESPDQETMLATRDEFDNRRKVLSDALGVLKGRDRRIFEMRRLAEEPDRGAGRRARRVERARAPDQVRAFGKVRRAVKNGVTAIETPAPRPMH